MPLDSNQFRPVCGLFYSTYQGFMLRRARRAARLYTRLVSVRIKVELLLVIFFSNLLLCCGDIESNPGPVDSPQKTPARHETSAIADTSTKQIMDCINKQGERFESTLKLLRSDLGEIKSDILYVRKRCDGIEDRCKRLEGDCSGIAIWVWGDNSSV